jgi:DNA-binding transcriptional LysR family regulator
MRWSANCAGHMAPALAALTARHPALNVRIVVDDRLIDLIDARVDLALRAGRLPDSNWVARRLCAFGWAICAAPGYLARAGTPRTPAELAAHTWIGHEAGAGTLPLELRGPGGARETLRVVPRVVCNNQLSIGQLCAAGIGLALLVRPDAAELLHGGRLVPLLADWTLADTPVWAVTPQRGGQPAKVRHAIAALAQTLRALPGAVD